MDTPRDLSLFQLLLHGIPLIAQTESVRLAALTVPEECIIDLKTSIRERFPRGPARREPLCRTVRAPVHTTKLDSFTMRAMPLFVSTFALSLAYVIGANAAPCNDNVSSIKLQEIMTNFSSSFGWALAGSATSTKQLETMCDNITETGHGMWATQGLIPERIVKPVCNQSHTGPNATLALPWIVYYNTRVFSMQITNAFASQNKSADMEYLCDNPRYRLLDGFGIEGATAIDATCNAAAQARNPRPEAALAMIDKNATDAYRDALSRLYGFLFASSACTNSELDDYCAQASQQVTSWDKMMLNGALVEETICDAEIPMSSEDAKTHLKEWMSKAFSTIVGYASNVDGWHAWLCEQLDAGSMETVGLDGRAISTQVCNDAEGAVIL